MNCADANFLVDLLDPDTEHHGAAERWAEAHAGEPVGVPAFAAFEVLYGLADGGADEERLKTADERLEFAVSLPFERSDALAAALLHGELRAAGEELSFNDTIVGAMARRRGATLVTRDSDFERVPELETISYVG